VIQVARAAVIAVLAALVSWFAVTPSNAVTKPSTPPLVYTYDGLAHTAPSNDATTERGPPTAYNRASAYDAVDRWPLGPSACSDRFTTLSWTTCDDLAGLVRGARASGATREPARGTVSALYVFRQGRVAANGVSKFGNLTHSSAGIAPFSTQRAITAGQRGTIQAHHLIERRFARQIGGSTDDWATIVVTRSEHQVFTNAWRQAIPYGAGTRTASRAQIEGAARQIYSDYPEILRALGLG
jgi:hypothetical protein